MARKSWEPPEEYLLCRDTTIHHAWQPTTTERAKHGFNRYFICTRCKARKRQKIDRSGYPVGASTTNYEPGYLRPKGSGVMTRADNAKIRLAVVAATPRQLREESA